MLLAAEPHTELLWGLVLAGIPVLLHLIMRQKPKVLPFPAFRFLRLKHLRNRRKLRLQHLLLLALRALVIGGLCVALVEPKLSGVPWAFSSERPVAAVLVFDTSPSMEYSAGGATRLDEARQRARELLDEMRSESAVAVLDTADEAGGEGPGWLSPGRALSRLAGLRVRPANGPLNRPLDTAFRMLAGKTDLPRFVYVFSDRTRASWDARAAAATRPEGVTAVFVDVGVDSPKDLAIDKVEIDPPVVTPGAPMKVRVTVRASGTDFDTELTCRIEGDADAERGAEKKAIRLSVGQSQVFQFERPAPARPPGSPLEVPFQVTTRVATNDALPFNNVRHATFLARERRKVLTLVDGAEAKKDVPPWRAWQVALDVVGAFQCDVRSLEDAGKMTEKDLKSYPVICLFEVVPDGAFWKRLADYVQQGGGLVVVPGGNEWLPRVEAINKDAADVLPAKWKTIVTAPAGAEAFRWTGFPAQHPLTNYFLQSTRNGTPDYGTKALWPSVYAYWATEAATRSGPLATFTDDKRGAVLWDRTVGHGRVLQLTTPLDFRELDRNRRWTNYWQESSFGIVLADQVCHYLAGDSVLPELNFLCGQPVMVSVPPPAASPPYTLQGPNLVLAEANLPAPGPEGRLAVPQAAAPGNFTVLDGKNAPAAAFSLNVRAEESLLDRVPAEEIESVLGPGSLLQVGRTVSLKQALEGLQPPPVELLPWLMMVVLLVLTGESLLANKFYRRAAPTTEQPAAEGGAS